MMFLFPVNSDDASCQASLQLETEQLKAEKALSKEDLCSAKNRPSGVERSSDIEKILLLVLHKLKWRD